MKTKKSKNFNKDFEFTSRYLFMVGDSEEHAKTIEFYADDYEYACDYAAQEGYLHVYSVPAYVNLEALVVEDYYGL